MSDENQFTNTWEEEVDEAHNWHYRYNRRLSCFSHGVATVAFSQDGKWLASGTGSGDLKIWDTGTWAEAAKVKGIRREEPRALVISPAQRWLVCVYASVMRVFHCKPPWRHEQAIPSPYDAVTKETSEWCCVCFSPMSEVDHPGGLTGHDNHLAAFSSNMLCVLDYSGGWGEDTPKRTRSIFHGSTPSSITYTSCGFWLVCGFRDGELQIWNHFSLTLEKTIDAHAGAIRCLSSSPRNAEYESRFVSCGEDYVLKVWHTSGWILEQIVPDTKADRSGVRSCTFSYTGCWVASVSSELCIWKVNVNVKGKFQLQLHQRLSAACGAEGLRTAAFCRHQDAIAVGSRDGVLGLWTKTVGPPPADELRKLGTDPADLWIPKVNSKMSSSEPWVMAKSLSRPMNKLTPDGVKSAVEVADKQGDWPARWRPLNWTQSINMRSVSTSSLSSNLAATAPATEIKCAMSMKAKLLAFHKNRARKVALHDSPLVETDDEVLCQDKFNTSGYSQKPISIDALNSPTLKRNGWKAGSFEFEDILSDFVKPKSPKKESMNMTLPANFKSPTVAAPAPGNRRRHERPKTVMPISLDDDRQPGRPAVGWSGAPMEGKNSQQAEAVKSKIMHATRHLVQRVTLDAQTIC